MILRCHAKQITPDHQKMPGDMITDGHCAPCTGEIPLVTPTMNTSAACMRANMVKNCTKYWISAFRVLVFLPTSPLLLKEK
jgi:hypothetical protein